MRVTPADSQKFARLASPASRLRDAPRLVRSKLEGFLSPADRKRSAQAAERAAGGVGEPAAAGAR